MKLAVIGGGGVRAPLFVAAALRRAAAAGLEELYLMDIDAERLAVIAGLCRSMAQRFESQVRIIPTTDAQLALEGADYIVTTIRVGGEPGRVLDERIALRQGVLGQETTGPGGFAMAMRAIPALLVYAELAQKLAPRAWIFNFSNPAGLVTQALRWRGYEKTVGICDGANLAQHDIARWLMVPPQTLRAEVYGLNHLSWTRRVWLDGKDVLPALLQDPVFCSGSSLKVFDFRLIQMMGLFLNEYLYYYYYPERAVEQITSDVQTRGEEVQALNRKLFASLAEPSTRTNPDEALRTYFAYEKRRSATYMHYANPHGLSMERADQFDFRSLQVTPEDGEGYAGVALDMITALETKTPLYTALNVPNGEAIQGLHPDDVVEVSCQVAQDQITPLGVTVIPPQPAHLIYAVKDYERLAVKAIFNRSRRMAVEALMAHPLVQSFPRAERLVDEYLGAHARYIGEWN